jgi:hypothetical protein
MEGNLVAYSDVDGLVTVLHINHSPEKWRLFVDSTTLRLTAVLFSKDYMLYLLTAIGLTLGGSSTVHIYKQTIHRTTQWNRKPRTEHI